MPNYKLVYFDLRGRGEFIRMMLHYKNISFEEEIITLDKWPEVKNSELAWGKGVTDEQCTCRLLQQATARLLRRRQGNDAEHGDCPVLGRRARYVAVKRASFFIDSTS